MQPRREDDHRVLSIDPTSRGFGFAVLEGATMLIDWGTKDVGRADSESSLRHVSELIEHYRPDVVVVEDVAHAGSRRCGRIRTLVRSTEHLATERNIVVVRVSTRQVRETFGGRGAATKAHISAALVDHFPELRPKLPPRRKPWMSQDERMSIFDAVAFAIAYYFFRAERTE